MSARFDGYVATVRGVPAGELASLVMRHRAYGDRVASSDRGYHGFGAKWALRDESGAELSSVLWGGQHRDLVMIEAKGERTPELVQDLRETFPQHACTRADSCVDVEGDRAWEDGLELGLELKRRYQLRGEKRGDWDYPEDGRTLYLGAPSSAVRVRIYEKGKQPEYRHLERWGWVRFETQVRPEKAARSVYAAASASEVWGAAPWTRELAARLLELQVSPLPPYGSRRLNARDAALRWMCEQYGQHLVSLAQDLGDWKCVGLTLGELVAEVTQARVRRRNRQEH